MKITGVLFLFILMLFCGMNSCVVQAPVTETVEEEFSNQEKAELSVKSYLKRTYDSLGTYQPYGFGVVKEIIPEQVTQLEELKSMKTLLPGMKDHYGNKLDSVMLMYDTLIAQKEREIKVKKIRSFWKISHLFLVVMKNDSILANEVEFVLDPNFKVYDAHSSIHTYLSKEEAKWFEFYYMQYPLFDTWDDEADAARSQEVYDFYDKKLMQSSENKDAVLKRILFIIRHIHNSGEFSTQKIAEAIIRNEIKKTEGKAYQSVKFSTLKAIIKKADDGTQELIGYSMVHLYNSVAVNLIVEKAYYFEFDAWLILAGYLPVQPPYETYFEN